jgi:hypothetical protein
MSTVPLKAVRVISCFFSSSFSKPVVSSRTSRLNSRPGLERLLLQDDEDVLVALVDGGDRDGQALSMGVHEHAVGPLLRVAGLGKILACLVWVEGPGLTAGFGSQPYPSEAVFWTPASPLKNCWQTRSKLVA